MKIPVEELDVGIILNEHEVTPVGQLGCERRLSLAAMHKPIPKGRVQKAEDVMLLISSLSQCLELFPALSNFVITLCEINMNKVKVRLVACT